MAPRSPMTFGMVGAGRMGASIARRAMADGHRVVVHDVDPTAAAALVADGAIGAASLAELAWELPTPRVVWMMVPAGTITATTLTDVARVLDAGDIIVDGGNTHYTDDLCHAEELRSLGIHQDAGLRARDVDARPRPWVRASAIRSNWTCRPSPRCGDADP